jgi:hypothetical protein
MRDRDLALKLIRDKGCDVILSIAVIDQKSETYYQPGAVSVSVGYGYPRTAAMDLMVLMGLRHGFLWVL